MRKPGRLKTLVASGALLGGVGLGIGVAPSAHASTFWDYGWYPSYVECDAYGYFGQAMGWWIAHYCDFRIVGAELFVAYS